jgi:hypothetical protein
MDDTANLYYYSDTHLNEGIRVDGPKESRALTYTTNVAPTSSSADDLFSIGPSAKTESRKIVADNVQSV